MPASFVSHLYRHHSVLTRVSTLIALTLFMSACSTVTPTIKAPAIASPSVALVLGGGGAKGFAHIGVIKALEENGITPTLIVGTSVGSLVGSLYASGYTTPAQLERLALTTADNELTDFVLSNQGFVEGIKLRNFINDKVDGRAIEDFPIGFAAVAAEKHTLKKTVFTSGNAGLAVQASCSVPNIFIAPRIPEEVGKKYIDGGVVSLVPVDSARALGANVIIAVDVTTANNRSFALKRIPTFNSVSSFWGFMENSIAAQPSNTRALSMRHERDRADIVITPDVGHISSIDTRQRQALITAGTQATTSQIYAIKQLIKQKSDSKYATL